MFSSRLFLLSICVLVLVLAGCGNKGPLVLPDKKIGSEPPTTTSSTKANQ